jgi:SWI/SNF-related matrix-associated actin-dependent regulator of chromatin subfamily A3
MFPCMQHFLLQILDDVLANMSSRYINNITGEQQKEPPFDFKGGILADDMGLGKTLSTIALIVHGRNQQPMHAHSNVTAGFRRIKSTLIVVPFSLLGVWEGQLSSHLRPNTVSWRKHHGNSRLRSSSLLGDHDIIITTYDTVASEWRQLAVEKKPLHSIHWHRIVLDEAHYIRDRTTARARAVFSLQATSRWALSGTPIQNSLKDLASLLEYLRVYPYSDPYVFNAHIIDLWKANAEEEAVERLSRLIKAITLRRLRTVLDIPKREDAIRYLRFSPEEKSKYMSTAAPIVDLLDNALLGCKPQAGLYLNALQKINSLRMLCNLGVLMGLVKQEIELSSDTDSPKATPTPTLDFVRTPATSDMPPTPQTACPLKCSDCSVDLDPAEHQVISKVALDGIDETDTDPHLMFCTDCTEDSSMDLPEQNNCPLVSTILSTTCPGNESSKRSRDLLLSGSAWPTKIKALVKDIHDLPSDTKCVVFSFWTSTLQIIENALNSLSIGVVRYDGTIPPNNRTKALESFRRDTRVQVILISITCGAVGLDLTAASQIFLMEPQWNPTVEEQALSRVHRMGQTKEVNTVRYIMEGSFEEHVIKVQNRKKHLADLVLSKKQLSESALALSRLQHLRSLLG